MRFSDRDVRRSDDAIVREIACRDFPFEMRRAFELALLRTFCVPSIATLLDRSGGFFRQGRQRHASTDVLLGDILAHGYDSPRGRAAIARINEAHRHPDISNDDLRYVLSTFIFEPIRCIDWFGWRRLRAVERDALFRFWQAIGGRLHIEAIPDEYTEFERLNRAYEARHFCATDAGRRLAAAARDDFASRFPRPLRPAARAILCSLLGDEQLRLLSLEPPAPALRRVVPAALRGRARLMRVWRAGRARSRRREVPAAARVESAASREGRQNR